MPKKPLQDVVPPKKSIRQVVLPRDRAERGVGKSADSQNSAAIGGMGRKPDTAGASSQPPIVDVADKVRSMDNVGFGMKRKKILMPETKTTSKRLWLVALVVVVLIYVSATFVFAGASVTVVPRTQTTVLDALFTVSIDASATELSYKTMSLSHEGKRAFEATGEIDAEKKASGRITVFNKYSSKPQRLIKNTRFEAGNGLIYKIPDAIVIPGVEDIDGEKVPGSVETDVLAEFAGEEYNIGPTEFTVPGLKGDPRFDDIYAESVGPMSGGFLGKIKTVDSKVEAEAMVSIEAELKDALREEALNKIPEGFILYNDAVTFTTEKLPNTASGQEGMVDVRVRAELLAMIFDRAELSKHIAASTIADFDGQEVKIDNLGELVFSPPDGDIGAFEKQMKSQETAQFLLKGSPVIEWTFDLERLKLDLAGKSKAESVVNTVLSAYPGIESADISLKPFWDGTFPKNPDKIKIITQ